MATIHIVNVSTPNDGLGDPLRVSQVKANDNFAELNTKKVEVITGQGLTENNFSDADKAKLNSIDISAQTNVQPNWFQTDNTKDDFIKNKPDYLNAVGSFHYADLSTQTTPLNAVANVALKLTNDTDGSFTNTSNAPYGVSSVWDSVNNQFDFSQLAVGDLVKIRPDFNIDLDGTNKTYEVYINFAIGSGNEWNLHLINAERKSTTEFHKNGYIGFDISNEDARDFPAEIYFKSDANGTVKVNGWFIEVLRKNINIVDFSDINAVHKTGDETIDGKKTFLKPIVLKSQTTNTQSEIYTEADELIFQNGDSLIPFKVKRGVLSLKTISNNLIRFLFSGNARDFTLPATSGTFALTTDIPSITITKTKSEIDDLIADNNLQKGATYKINGCDISLYGGTTLYLKALETNKLEKQGTGEFYNPKYFNVDGLGIYNPYVQLGIPNIAGLFDDNEMVEADNGAMGAFYGKAQGGFVTPYSGDWSTAVSITGYDSGATADVSILEMPSSHEVDDVVFWGGYAWVNVSGNLGAVNDVLHLSNDWTRIGLSNATYYEKVYDIIEYDYANDWISRRYNVESNIDVIYTKVTNDYISDNWVLNYNAIAVQQWGNPYNYFTEKGVGNKKINNGYDEAVNFRGQRQLNFILKPYSVKANQLFGLYSIQQSFTLGQGASQNTFALGQNAYQYTFTLGQGAGQYSFTLGQNAGQSIFTLGQNASQNTFTLGQGAGQYTFTLGQGANQQSFTLGQGAGQYSFTLGQGSEQQNFTLGEGAVQESFTLGQNAGQYSFTLGQGAGQYSFTLGQGAGQYNFTLGQNAGQSTFTLVQGSDQQNFTLGQDANQNTFTLSQGAYQRNLILNDSINFQNITLKENARINYSSFTYLQNIQNVTFKSTTILNIPDLTTATLIYDVTLLKEVYNNPNGTIRLSYNNNSDALIITDITD